MILVEGYLDMLGFHKQGVDMVLAAGTSGLSEGQASIINDLKPKKIFVVTDGDSAGKIAAVKISNRLKGSRNWRVGNDVKIIPMVAGKDPFDEFYRDETDVMEFSAANAVSPKDFLLSQKLDDMLFKRRDDGVSYSVLTDHTSNIAYGHEVAGAMGVKLPEQRNSDFEFKPVHHRILDYKEIDAELRRRAKARQGDEPAEKIENKIEYDEFQDELIMF